jgi:outer membrane protein assembly factor BamD
MRRNPIAIIPACLLAVLLLGGFGIPFKKKKYETPISKETLQPDKVLFDAAIKDIEHGSYETARVTLNTLINTYDTSEYLAKAKLAIADSWYREGGSHGLSQAEAEYKDFILFYPNMEESAESQFKVCNIHYKQMDKADRDVAQAQRAEDECRQVLVQFPSSKFARQAEQLLRNVQEVIADKEFLAGDFYHHKGSFPAAANRFSYLSQQYPLYSSADQALWELADSYKHMGDKFEDQEGDALTRIVKDYPFSAHVDAAKSRLEALKKPVPTADPAAYARQKFEQENHVKPSVVSKATGFISGRPDVSTAAKMGAPAMTLMKPPVPVSVPATAAGTLGPTGVSDVVAGVVGDTTTLDQQSDARLSAQPVAPGGGVGENKASVGSNGQPLETDPKIDPTKPAAPAANGALPTNHPVSPKQMKDLEKMQKKAETAAKKKQKKTGTPAADPAATTPATTPASSSTTPPPAKP